AGDSAHCPGPQELAVLLDRSGRAPGRHHLQCVGVVSSARGRSLCLSGRCVAARRYASGPGGPPPHAAAVETPLRRQSSPFRPRPLASLTPPLDHSLVPRGPLGPDSQDTAAVLLAKRHHHLLVIPRLP